MYKISKQDFDPLFRTEMLGIVIVISLQALIYSMFVMINANIFNYNFSYFYLYIILTILKKHVNDIEFSEKIF